ncbi:MAG: 1-deoxy-D-xylulose-5-phosphate reductoisomerase [Deltaproteobacteria bacterium]|nr:1-deoxy-D-xylulose-5-phosphate reductoisomerase [Deltaproteobacteria bacterium]MBW2071453.1 1-deoxy-D-xylulose-5-phosphate reductoisomerase [Deltaproteobacteria bacterium]
MKKLVILGSTGSIGCNTLEVVEQFPDRFAVSGLAAGRNIDLLARQTIRHQPQAVAVFDHELAAALQARLQGVAAPEVLVGAEGYQQLAASPEADMVVSAIVGAAGLLPTWAAIQAGKQVALANKETLVMAGSLIMEEVRNRQVRLLPVDSEHSAIFQALQGHRRQDVKRILLTASGGPFLHKSMEELARVTPEQALAHPNWKMGAKITIDSATLMNKGLEVIEASWLFDMPVDRIVVHIHPQSIVHSMVEYVDGSVIAQLGIPDMRAPIAYALAYPERLPLDLPPLDLFAVHSLTFQPPDLSRFPCLQLALQACDMGGTMPAVLNAANEVAVEGFLEGRIPFIGIAACLQRVLDEHQSTAAPDIEAVLAADAWAREKMAEILKRI